MTQTIENNGNVIEIYALAIWPIENIVKKLGDRDYRDCDIKWLNEKLKTYTSIAAKTIHLKIAGIKPLPEGMLNDYTYDRYTRYFTILLKHFRSYIA